MTVQVAIAKSVAPEGRETVYTEQNFSPNGLVHFEKGTDNATNTYRGTGYYAYCGECDRPFHLHPVKSNDLSSSNPCSRTEPWYGPDSTDYLGHEVAGSFFPYVREYLQDLSDGFTDEDVDPYEYEDWPSEYDKIERWTDTDPTIGASLLNPNDPYAPSTHSNNIVPPEQLSTNRAVFLSDSNVPLQVINLIDLDITARYHAKIINHFVNKNGTAQIGSIELGEDAAGNITATCVNQRECWYKHEGRYVPRVARINPRTATRTDMEEFTLSIIRHGNNHAANWFRSRETYYKVHASNCDLNCNPDEAHCNQNGNTNYATTDDYVLAYLLEHNQYCKADGCACTQHLADLAMPIPLKESA